MFKIHRVSIRGSRNGGILSINQTDVAMPETPPYIRRVFFSSFFFFQSYRSVQHRGRVIVTRIENRDPESFVLFIYTSNSLIPKSRHHLSIRLFLPSPPFLFRNSRTYLFSFSFSFLIAVNIYLGQTHIYLDHEPPPPIPRHFFLATSFHPRLTSLRLTHCHTNR